MNTIPQCKSGLQGLTSCCHADATFHGSTLVCRACGGRVQPVQVPDKIDAALHWAIKAQIDELIDCDDLIVLQDALLADRELKPVAPKGVVFSAEEIERAAKKD